MQIYGAAVRMSFRRSKVRSEPDETVNGRSDKLNSIAAANCRVHKHVSQMHQRIRVGSKVATKQSSNSSSIVNRHGNPRNLEGSNEKGEFRHFTSDLHMWMQACMVQRRRDSAGQREELCHVRQQHAFGELFTGAVRNK